MTDKLDNIDMVKLLRILAIVIFAFSMVSFIVLSLDFLSSPLNHDSLPFILMQSAAGIANAMYSPAVLLALAEVIRIMRKQEACKHD